MSDNARTLGYFVSNWREACADDEDKVYCLNAARRWAAWIIAGEC